MFGKKKKASGIIAGTSPAQVYRELPVLPRTSQTSIRDEWSRAALEGSSFGEPPVRAALASQNSAVCDGVFGWAAH